MKPRPGRPVTPATKARRENEKLWAEERPLYAVDNAPTDFFKHLVSGEAFASVRNGLGLSHKSIPHALVFDMLKVMEGATEEFFNKTNAAVGDKKAAIRSQTKAGGRKLPPNNLRKVIAVNCAGLAALNEFFFGRTSYKALQKTLDDLRLPVPDARTLRRWRKSEIGH